MSENKIVLENDPILFSEEELKASGLTQEELDILQDATALVDTADLLPEEIDGILDRIEKEIPNDFQAGLAKLGEIGKNDPAFFKQIMALYEVTNSVTTMPPPKTEKLSIEDLQNAASNEKLEELLNKIRKSTK